MQITRKNRIKNDKIALLEISSINHYNLLNSWVYVLEEKGIDYVIYTTEEISKHLRCKEGNIIKKGEESTSSFLKKMNSEITLSCKKLIITSIQSDWLSFLFFKIQVPIYVTVHNANTWTRNISFSPKSFIKYLVRKKYLKKSSNLIVNSLSMKNFLYDQGVSKSIQVMPFHLYTNCNVNSHQTMNEKLVITLPGMISEKRKKYDEIFKLANDLSNYIKVIFLGCLDKDNTYLNKDVLENHIRKGSDIIYFKTFISDEVFNQYLYNTDLIFSHLKTDFEQGDMKEVYGLTKDSGVSYAMITNSLPGLFNKDFKNLVELESSTCYFNSYNDLKKTIMDLYKDKNKLNNLKKNAILNSEKFSIKSIANQISV